MKLGRPSKNYVETRSLICPSCSYLALSKVSAKDSGKFYAFCFGCCRLKIGPSLDEVGRIFSELE